MLHEKLKHFNAEPTRLLRVFQLCSQTTEEPIDACLIE